MSTTPPRGPESTPPQDDARTRDGVDPDDLLPVDNARIAPVIPLSLVPNDESPRQVTDDHEDNQQADGLRADARGYSWPPFEVGHTLSLVHGAYSERAIEAKAAAVHAALLEVAPWCNEERYMPSVHRYLQATAREQLAHAALMASTKLSTRLLETATAAARLAWQMADQLGLTPAGHAKLKSLVAGGEIAEAALGELAARGRAIRERAESGFTANEDQTS